MLDKELEQTLNQAFRDARSSNHEFMTVEHLLLALLDNNVSKEIGQLFKQGKVEEAEQSLLAAIENSPGLAEAYVQMGGICLKRGDIEGCLSWNQRAVKTKPGSAYARCESSKGELGHYIVSDGGATAFRNKVRSPSFCNLQVVEKVGVGQMVSDLVALIGSLDIVLGEIDR